MNQPSPHTLNNRRSPFMQTVLIAMFAALSFVAIWLIRIPYPAPVGNPFIHFGNMVTILAALLIGGWQGVFITVLQWVAVLFGIFYKSLSRKSIPAVSLTIYLVMGWTIVFFLPMFVRRASAPLLALIALGGLLYTLGAWFYARKGFRYHHMVWHLLINLAVAAHFVGIVFYLC